MASASPAARIASACSGSVMRPTAITGVFVACLTARANANLIAGAELDRLFRRDAAARHMRRRRAAFFERLRERDCLLDVPPAFDPIGSGKPYPHGFSRVHRLPHRVENFERKPHPVFEAAAVFVVAPVGERRQELVKQIAVRGVHLDPFEAEPVGAARRRGEILRAPGRAPRGRAPAAPPRRARAATRRARPPPIRQARRTAPARRRPRVLRLDALRPAWASWMASGIGEILRIASRIRASALSLASQ